MEATGGDSDDKLELYNYTYKLMSHKSKHDVTAVLWDEVACPPSTQGPFKNHVTSMMVVYIDIMMTVI